jgi:hypothetical protein
MAIFEEALGTAATGIVVTVAAAVVAPILLPVVVSVGRPLIKSAIKGAILAYGRGQEVIGEMQETLEDLTAEARSELRTGANGGRARLTSARSRQARGNGSTPRRRGAGRGGRRARATQEAAATA